jgi:hypothetical protein
MSWWRRRRDWQRAGLSDLLHFALLNSLSRMDRIDWSCVVVTVVPLATGTTEANCHDSNGHCSTGFHRSKGYVEDALPP